MNRMNRSGIYTITSPSGGLYVGAAASFTSRWSKHRAELKSGKHHCQPLQRACDKYGLESMQFKILLVCDKKDLILFEQRAIDTLNPEYNCMRLARSPLGMKRSPETCAKIGAAHRGLRHTPEARLKMSLSRKGVRTHVTPEYRAKISAAGKGRIFSPETKAKISASRMGLSYGPMSPAHRQKIADANKGIKFSPEAIAKRWITRRAKAMPSQERLYA